MFQLRSHGDSENAVTLSSDGAMIIGRSDSCDLKIRDPSASRVHCRIVVQNGQVTLYDAGSRWGTYVNGQRISACELHPGDCISLGETSIHVTLNRVVRSESGNRGDVTCLS